MSPKFTSSAVGKIKIFLFLPLPSVPVWLTIRYFLSDLIITVSPSSRNLEGLSLDHGRQTGINLELLGSSEYNRTGSSNLIRATSFR